jgi:hypothetical protein
MKITVNVDITPEEAREFLGLPNVEKLQEHLMTMAQEQFRENGAEKFNEFVSNAFEPMMGYQKWLQGFMTPPSSSGAASENTKK